MKCVHVAHLCCAVKIQQTIRKMCKTNTFATYHAIIKSCNHQTTELLNVTAQTNPVVLFHSSSYSVSWTWSCSVSYAQVDIGRRVNCSSRWTWTLRTRPGWHYRWRSLYVDRKMYHVGAGSVLVLQISVCTTRCTKCLNTCNSHCLLEEWVTRMVQYCNHSSYI